MTDNTQGSHCELADMDISDIEQVFEAFDTDKLGYLTLNQFEKVAESRNISTQLAGVIFDSLDKNQDGLVEQSEFVSSFNSLPGLLFDEESSSPREGRDTPAILATEDVDGFNQNNNNNTKDDSQKEEQKLDTPVGYRRRASTPRTSALRSKSWCETRIKMRKSSPNVSGMLDEVRVYSANQGSWDSFAASLGEAFYGMSSYDGISDVHKSLESIGNAELLRNYEAVVQGVVREVAKVQKDMMELEASVEKEKENTNQRQTALEEEMESQIAKEKELRREERMRADADGEKMREQYEHQIDQLQSAISKLKKFDEKLSTTSPYEKELETMREKIRRLNQENSTLKNKLTEAETNLILMQNNMKEMELANQEKTLEYIRDEDETLDRDEERDRISREVESLHSSQRQLIDSNDTLREALDKTMKRASVQRQQIGGLPMEYLTSPEYLRSGRSSRASNLEMDALAECDPRRNGYLVHEFDSGVGTLRDDFEDSETDWADESFRRGSTMRRVRRNPSNASWASGSSRPIRSRRHEHRKHGYQTHSDEDNDVTNASDITDDELKNISQSSTLSSESRGRLSNRGGRSTPSLFRKVITPDVTLGHNKRMYKVVLCGDSGVGKTSFIFRVCRNVFHRFNKSTLGVDFQIKTFQLEHDKSISLQLWDTAGQERFRSISASYFRRAEGVLLLYDCTNQRSFINVRDWMETITMSIPEGTPIMICGHKVDLREDRELDGRDVVSSQEGAQLAANYGVLFVETSALDGCNVTNAVAMLARHIHLDDDSNETASVKKLDAVSEKAERKACCKQG